ncbi:MAG: glycosyltransferase family 87 protein [Bryobacteraceae bacterium]|nr:glycosyltransferase family 87 protein [Bryobacteraceae bacterium]
MGRTRVSPLLVLAGVVCNLLIVVPAAVRAGFGGGDYLSFYAGGKLALSESLYEPEAVAAVQRELGWESASLPFTRLPVVALAHRALTAVPYEAAHVVWQCLNAAALGVYLMLLPGGSRTAGAVVLAWLLPAYVALQQGQDTPLLLLCVAGALATLERREFWAGVLLGVCAIKAHLFLGAVVFVVRRGSKGMWAGGAAAGAVLALSSTALQGWDWPQRMLQAAAQPDTNKMELMPALVPMLQGAGVGWVVAAVAAIGTLCWVAAGHGDRRAALAAAIAPGLLAAPHIYLQDWTLLAPALLLGLTKGGMWTRWTAMAVLAPPVTLLALLGWRAVPVAALAVFAAVLACDRLEARSESNG